MYNFSLHTHIDLYNDKIRAMIVEKALSELLTEYLARSDQLINRLTMSVIICTRNRLDCISECLASIAEQTAFPNELIIVDSSDIPLIAQEQFTSFFTHENYPHTKLFYRHTRVGLTHQRNIGIDLAHSDIIYFFDDDTVLEHNYLKEMQRIFAGHPKYAGGTGYITNISPYKQTFRYFVRTFFLIQRNYTLGHFTSSGMPTHAYGTDQFKEVQTMSGCCSAYRSCIFTKHRFDENLKRYAYMEDCDLSKRVSNHHKLFYNPFARIAHNQSPLSRERLIDFRAMFSNYYTYLFFKNFYPENKIRIIAYLWSMLGLLIEALYSTVTQRNTAYIRGYWQGIYSYIREQRHYLH